jgi:hypothetical protein
MTSAAIRATVPPKSVSAGIGTKGSLRWWLYSHCNRSRLPTRTFKIIGE